MNTYPSCIPRNRDLDPKLLSVLRQVGLPTLEELWDIGEAKGKANEAKRKAEHAYQN